MRLVTYSGPAGDRAGVLIGDASLADAGAQLRREPLTMLELIALGPPAWESLERVATPAQLLNVSATRLRAPIPRTPRNVFCVGWNYSDHFVEGRLVPGATGPKELPDAPTFFSKNPATIVGPDEPVLHPGPLSEELDWEVELAVVIGRGGRDIPEERAMEHVFGYTVANDVSVRDHQQRRHGGQWFKGKNFDTHLPLGPWIVAGEIEDPQQLRITSRINGVTKQDSNTRHMVFPIRRIIAELSAGLTLEPGDVIITGTPDGVGFARKPPEFLRSGDVMEMEVERIGVLRNAVS
jgi:2-keto-4-pentenoate hydratase/2-oxohepta-3-ene-1,7-dioic acid hydratase in catechol pathway